MKRTTDWHSADIIAALRKAGWSLRRLSVDNGYNPTTLAGAMHRHWPRGEQIIAAVIGKNPMDIWPSRYTNNTKKGTEKARRRAA